MNPQVAAIVGALGGQTSSASGLSLTAPEETSFFPTLTAQEPVVFAKEPEPRSVATIDTSMPPDTVTEQAEIKGGETDQSGLTAFQVKKYASGTISLIKSVSSVYNGYIANSQYKMQANNKEFLASQNERAAELLKKNMRDINRAADADANVYRLQGVKTKSAQRVAQAASGFAVGKGTHGVMLDTTDARTQFNASMIMLKAGLQNAEILREIGGLKAQAIINRFDAKALKEQGEFAISKGWNDAVMHAISAGADFYVGYHGLEE